MKIIINTLSVLLTIFLRWPPGAGAARRSNLGDGYISDFNDFMEKMFSILPQPTKNRLAVNESKVEANVGYAPYWFGNQFPIAKKGSWNDYGMGDKLQELWAVSNKSLVGVDDILGAGGGEGQVDASGDEGERACPFNQGPTCELGDPPENITKPQQLEYIERTSKCDFLCTPEKRKVGLVCTVDSTATLFQEMDFCVMEKMNCLKGIAVVQATGQPHDWRRVPFAFKNGFGRISIYGPYEGNLYFYNKIPSHWGRRYWMILDGWPYEMLRSAMYCDDVAMPCWLQFPWFPEFATPLTWGWREYTIRWNKQTGYFLFSRGRAPHWWQVFFIEYFDEHPWDIKYIDVSSRKGLTPRYILHDLPFDLTLVNEGECSTGPKPMKIDTDEVHGAADLEERRYRDRTRHLPRGGQRSEDEAPYLEYPAA